MASTGPAPTPSTGAAPINPFEKPINPSEPPAKKNLVNPFKTKPSLKNIKEGLQGNHKKINTIFYLTHLCKIILNTIKSRKKFNFLKK